MKKTTRNTFIDSDALPCGYQYMLVSISISAIFNYHYSSLGQWYMQENLDSELAAKHRLQERSQEAIFEIG